MVHVVYTFVINPSFREPEANSASLSAELLTACRLRTTSKKKNTKPCMIFLRTQKLVIFLLGMREKSVRTVRGLICSLWKLAYNLLHGRPMTDVRSTITQNHVFLLFSSYSLNGGQCKHRVIMVFVLSLEHHIFFPFFFIQFLQLAVEECVRRIAYF